ncbi:MAG TPA: hypothetical protein VF754_09515 [Pyrinomonadaceae bacterium]
MSAERARCKNCCPEGTHGASRRIDGRAPAEDIVQEVFIQIYRNV